MCCTSFLSVEHNIGYRLGDFGFESRGRNFFFSPEDSGCIRGPMSLIFSRYQRLFPWGEKWPEHKPDQFPSLYTGCPRRNVKYFGRVFLMLNYTDITQNTYIQS